MGYLAHEGHPLGLLLRFSRWVGWALIALSLSSCTGGFQDMSTMDPTRSYPNLGTGFRYSPYGPATNPGAEYWAGVGQEMAKRFPASTPEVIWIVSELKQGVTRLTFPGTQADPYIQFSSQDENETALALFDQLGFRVWLQVEPGEAPVEKLFDLILSRYRSHPCVVGVGVDVEWHHSVVAAGR